MEEVGYTESILVTIKEKIDSMCGPQPGVSDSININMMGQQMDQMMVVNIIMIWHQH